MRQILTKYWCPTKLTLDAFVDAMNALIYMLFSSIYCMHKVLQIAPGHFQKMVKQV